MVDDNAHASEHPTWWNGTMVRMNAKWPHMESYGSSGRITSWNADTKKFELECWDVRNRKVVTLTQPETSISSLFCVGDRVRIHTPQKPWLHDQRGVVTGWDGRQCTVQVGDREEEEFHPFQLIWMYTEADSKRYEHHEEVCSERTILFILLFFVLIVTMGMLVHNSSLKEQIRACHTFTQQLTTFVAKNAPK